MKTTNNGDDVIKTWFSYVTKMMGEEQSLTDMNDYPTRKIQEQTQNLCPYSRYCPLYLTSLPSSFSFCKGVWVSTHTVIQKISRCYIILSPLWYTILIIIIILTIMTMEFDHFGSFDRPRRRRRRRHCDHHRRPCGLIIGMITSSLLTMVVSTMLLPKVRIYKKGSAGTLLSLVLLLWLSSSTTMLADAAWGESSSPGRRHSTTKNDNNHSHPSSSSSRDGGSQRYYWREATRTMTPTKTRNTSNKQELSVDDDSTFFSSSSSAGAAGAAAVTIPRQCNVLWGPFHPYDPYEQRRRQKAQDENNNKKNNDDDDDDTDHPLRSKLWEFTLHWSILHRRQKGGGDDNNNTLRNHLRKSTQLLQMELHPSGYCLVTRITESGGSGSDHSSSSSSSSSSVSALPVGLGYWTKRPWGVTISIRPLEWYHPTDSRHGRRPRPQRLRLLHRLFWSNNTNNDHSTSYSSSSSSSSSSPPRKDGGIWVTPYTQYPEYVFTSHDFHWNTFGQKPKLGKGTITRLRNSNTNHIQKKYHHHHHCNRMNDGPDPDHNPGPLAIIHDWDDERDVPPFVHGRYYPNVDYTSNQPFGGGGLCIVPTVLSYIQDQLRPWFVPVVGTFSAVGKQPSLGH
jgi:hypothetical protein